MSHSKRRFVIQEHKARRLHWDFRLEMDGVLKSWAVPKEPSMAPNVKRLAIQTEDHSLDYIDFEGEIEEGSYGAGLVTIWDSGACEILDKNARSIHFRLYGKKLSGDFVLVKTSYSPGNQWLLIRKKIEGGGKQENG